MRPARFSPSTRTRITPFCQRAKTASVDQRYDAFPPSAFEVSLARFAMAPLIPALAMFAKYASASPPAQAR